MDGILCYFEKLMRQWLKRRKNDDAPDYEGHPSVSPPVDSVIHRLNETDSTNCSGLKQRTEWCPRHYAGRL
ncbi:hypothetical protein [Vampirovibrio sp.]|uniref:hypothetical protein n=1 Tax=Vampirovibrio sp. TaxID=2717857 RepID=UPI00359430BC